MAKAKRDIKRKLRVFKHYRESGDVSSSCRHFGIAGQSVYTWKKLYQQFGEEGLINHKNCPDKPTLRIAQEMREKIILLRITTHLGPERICPYI